MEKYIEVITRMLELSETIEEGLEHMQIQLEKGNYEDSVQLFNDVVEAIYSVAQSIYFVTQKVPDNDIEKQTTVLHNALKFVLEGYENNNMIMAKTNLEYKLLPAYKEWRQELKRVLTPYILS